MGSVVVAMVLLMLDVILTAINVGLIGITILLS